MFRSTRRPRPSGASRAISPDGALNLLTGRAILYGLCAYGADGVHCAIETLRGEMLNELGQYGIASLEKLSRDLLVRTDQLPL